MKSVLTTAPGRPAYDQPPHPPHSATETAPVQNRQSHPVRRVTLVDRAALHLGLALIRWGRRPLELESRERRASHAEQHLARLERERQAQRWQLLNLPPR
ncbi:hypothetical protein ACVXZ4_05145 [Lacisediminihabitans sp. FW035]